ncbi:antibiotic biosynthesis monooxygenase [Stakelama sp. CBK3Z-3]|uniref:Antibiotic biosynthesis monooxygenase n=1 Tax=Stakelama flava TaxID=2860338 RepID=A0ABS6XPX2_9SPHN|nr:antibiotic biosynthesis monooxygenase [Stakelama flava]MBW4332264.1 antibiotic biosynthesis monooxygenase [Stakelama flava]MBW4332313.1 antibiotic biosynthesis monooxygenase [Stakelama flava]
MPHIVMAHCTALPGREDALARYIAELAAAVRKEAGNEGFEVFQKPEVERGWTMIERYRDRNAFEVHLAKPHTKVFNEALENLVEGGASDVNELAPVCQPDDAAPGVRGIDHVGVTVPDIEAASDFLTRAFGARTLYDVLPADADPMEGDEVEHQLGIPKGARIEHMRLMRIGASANIEMFRIANADQADAAGLADYGLQHIALYVDDMGAAVERLSQAGGVLLSDPHPLAGVEGGERNSGVYARAPWGMLIELISTPDGIDYPADCSMPRWKPKPNS